MLSVHPDIQGQGIGKYLLNGIETIAKQKVCTVAGVAVISQVQDLQDFYLKRGYKQTGERSCGPKTATEQQRKMLTAFC